MEPTVVDVSRFPDDVALMLLGSTLKYTKLKLYNPLRNNVDTAPETSLADEDVEAAGPEHGLLHDQTTSNAVRIIIHETPEDTTGKVGYVNWEGSGLTRFLTLKQGQSLACGLGIKHDDTSRIYLPTSIKLSVKDMELWVRATAAMKQEPEIYSTSKSSLDLPENCLRKRSGNFQDSAFNIKNIKGTLKDSIIDDSLFWFMLIALPIVYGSVHLAAWNFKFPTHTEKIMWRVACTTIASGIPFCIILCAILLLGYVTLNFIMDTIFGKDSLDSIIEDTWVGNLLGIVLGFLAISLAALYFGSRLFVITESFISTRSLPLGVFITVDWSTYIPHL
jgi:hypothetical protein